MAEDVHKRGGHLNEIVVVTFVVLLVLLLTVQTWPNIVAAARPERGATVHGQIMASPSPSSSASASRSPLPTGHE